MSKLTLTAAALLAVLGAGVCPATDSSWIGATGNWSDGAKWSTNPDVPDQIGDIAQLTTGSGPTTLNVAGVILGQLINDQEKTWTINTDVNNYSLTMQVGSGSALIRAKGRAPTLTVNPNVVIASDVIVRSERTDDKTQTVTLNGTLTGTGNVTAEFAGTGNNASGNITLASLGTTGTLTVQGNNSANGTMTATIGAIGSGVTTLTKTGSCRLVLNAANSYTGATTISGGTARFSNAAGLPATGNLTLGGGIFETIADMTRNGGAAAGEVSITADSSGFSARGAPVVVAIGGTASPTALTWGVAPFALAAANGTLILNAGTADNTLEFKNAINLGSSGSNTRTLSIAANVVTISGVISASGGTQGLTKSGAGTLVLGNAANTYNGTTTISAGVLRANDGSSLPTTGNLNLAGGVLETGANMVRNGGSATGEVRITAASSGFSANGAAVVVAMGGTTSPTALTWGTAPFGTTGTLILNGATANNTLEFKNAVNLNAATRTVQTDADVATLSGLLSTASGTAGLTKTGAATLVLANTANSYNGTTTISAGVLRANDGASLPATGNLNLAGGVFETGVNMVRTGGSAAGEVQITAANSGFSAYGAPVVVAIGGTASPTALTWGSAPFAPSTTLILNGATANNTLEFKNAINLGASGTNTRTVQTDANAVTLSGVLSASGGTQSLTKTGAGTLILSTANTYNGVTTVSAGTLLVSGSLDGRDGLVTVSGGARLGGSGTIGRGITVSSTGTLAPGGLATPGTLTVDLGATTGKITLNSGAKLAYRLGAGVSDRLNIVNVVASDIVLNSNVIDFTNVGGLGAGSYTLMAFYSDGGTTLTNTGKPTSGLIIGTGLASRPGCTIDYSAVGLIRLVVPAGPGTAILIR